MASQVPFPYITDLPPKAQRELERDFFELQRQIVGTATIFDAIIDGNLTASNSATHQYKNLTDLVAGETWTTTQHLNVGVKQGGPTAITEPGSVSLAGHGSISLFGLTPGPIFTNSGTDPNVLPWVWGQVTAAGSNTIFLQNLWLKPTSNGAVAGTIVFAVDCVFDTTITSVSSVSSNLMGCTFRGALTQTGGGTLTLFNCDTPGGITISVGSLLNYMGGRTGGITCSSTQLQKVYAQFEGNLSVTGSASGSTYNNTGGLGGSVTVSALNPIIVTGYWGAVTFSGTPTSGQRRFEGTVQGAGTSGLDFTGPGYVNANVSNSVTSNTILRGAGVMADLTIGTNNGTILQGIGLTNSQVRIDATTAGSGKLFALDANSNHNIIIASGQFSGVFSVASTDLGHHNRVITESTDSLLASFIASTSPPGPPGSWDLASEMEPAEGPPGPPGPPGLAPTGAMVIWQPATAPLGWRICDGTTFLRSEPLFQVIGTTFGTGDGSTTANLPTTATVDPSLTLNLIIKL